MRDCVAGARHRERRLHRLRAAHGERPLRALPVRGERAGEHSPAVPFDLERDGVAVHADVRQRQRPEVLRREVERAGAVGEIELDACVFVARREVDRPVSRNVLCE